MAVAEASQLLEAEAAPEFDRVVLVVAPDEVRWDRAKARGTSRAETQRRSAAQLDPKRVRARADDVIENTGTVEELKKNVAAAWRRWRAVSPPAAAPGQPR